MAGARPVRCEDAALKLRPLDFVLGFDEREDGAAGLERTQRRRDAQPLRSPAGVNDRQVQRLGRFPVEEVGAFVDDDARIAAEFPVEDAVAGVHGVDAQGALLKQAVREAAAVAAEVGADQAGNREAEMPEGEFQLQPSFAHVAARFRPTDARAFHGPTAARLNEAASAAAFRA